MTRAKSRCVRIAMRHAAAIGHMTNLCNLSPLFFMNYRHAACFPLIIGLTGCMTATVTPRPNMMVESSAFRENESIPQRYTCDGVNVSPPLQFSNLPEETASIAVIVDDADATNGTFTHWTMWNIDPVDMDIEEGDIPGDVVEGVIGSGNNGYTGPCPPSGEHRYFFKAYALSTMLNLDSTATVEQLESAMADVILDEAALMGVYERSSSSTSSSTGTGDLMTQPGSTVE